VTPHAAPTLFVHGTKDAYVAHGQAVWLVDRLKAVDVEAELLTLEGAGHGFKAPTPTGPRRRCWTSSTGTSKRNE
jgi:dipeptidyl aminopeptidase/acylaminoacyl peptidase